MQNRVAEFRKARGLTPTELAQKVGVSRQTIYSIESGIGSPNTDVALRLARELQATVEELFSLPAEKPDGQTLPSELLSTMPPVKGQAVRISRIGSRWISVPASASPYYMPESDGVIGRLGYGGRADLSVFEKGGLYHKRLVIAGCDPATQLLARMVEKISGVEIVSAAASSRQALQWLKDDKVHVAGTHLEDPETGEFNLPFLKREFAMEDFSVITFAMWEEGLVMVPGNPKAIQKIQHLARKDVRFVNRERGSGSRGLLDQLLEGAGVAEDNVRGYDREVPGHLAAAYCVLSGEADCCLATRSAARTFGLDFRPLHFERYDLVVRKRTLAMPSMQAFLDVLQRSALRRQLEEVAGYDTSRTGSVVV